MKQSPPRLTPRSRPSKINFGAPGYSSLAAEASSSKALGKPKVELVSDLSSLDDEQGNFDLLNPSSRKFLNDKEYLKYVRIQMWWNFLSVGFLGIYACFLATVSVINNVAFLEL